MQCPIVSGFSMLPTFMLHQPNPHTHNAITILPRMPLAGSQKLEHQVTVLRQSRRLLSNPRHGHMLHSGKCADLSNTVSKAFACSTSNQPVHKFVSHNRKLKLIALTQAVCRPHHVSPALMSGRRPQLPPVGYTAVCAACSHYSRPRQASAAT